jgi:hypothetical protein
MPLPPLPGMHTLGMGMAGLAVGGAFAAGMALGVALGAAGAGGAWIACRMMRRRGRWRDEDRIEGMPPAAGPNPGDDSPQLPAGEAPVV